MLKPSDFLKVPSGKYQQSEGHYSDIAARQPIVITKHGKPYRILMCVEDFNNFSQAKIELPDKDNLGKHDGPNQ